jgi:hypothetical protein
MDGLDCVEQQLIEARDALIAYWEQSEGQACFLALRVAEDALADYRTLDGVVMRQRDPAGWRRIRSLADEVTRLRAPLDATI